MPEFYDLPEIAEKTGMAINFIRRLVSEAGDIIPTTRGDSNRLLFDNNTLILLDRAGQLKAKGLTLSEIINHLKADLGTLKNVVRPEENRPDVFVLMESLKAAELRAQKAENEFDKLQMSNRGLPAGGDPARLRHLDRLVGELKGLVKPRWRHGRRVVDLWGQIEELLSSSSEN